MHGLASPVLPGWLALHPPVLLEPIENTGERWLLDADARCDFRLRELVTAAREMRERSPLAHAQTERLEALVELRAPNASRLVDEEAELLDVGVRHWRSLAC
jgi:hypothetical protein